MLDIHCHIIPEVDDGSENIEQTLKMLKISEMDNTDKIIATPHYITGNYENNFDLIEKKVDSLNKAAKQNSIKVKVYTGQEIFLDNKTIDLYVNGIIRGINYTKYLLVEFPMNSYDESMSDILYELRVRGAEPIIAHPERYTYFIENPNLINEFVKEGYLFQINTGSILGIFGKNVKDTSKIFIKNNICDFIASDAHTTHRRCPGLSKALNNIEDINEEVYKKVINNMDLLLNNKFIKATSELITKKKLFKWF